MPALLVTQTLVWNPTNRAKLRMTDRLVHVNQDLAGRKLVMSAKVNNGRICLFLFYFFMVWVLLLNEFYFYFLQP